MNEVHLRDFQRYNVAFDEYMKQYFIGHYNPRGNHFFAFSIKDKVVEWLDPKPITYRQTAPEFHRFQGLPAGWTRQRAGATSGALVRKFRSDGHIGAERAGAWVLVSCHDAPIQGVGGRPQRAGNQLRPTRLVRLVSSTGPEHTSSTDCLRR